MSITDCLEKLGGPQASHAGSASFPNPLSARVRRIIHLSKHCVYGNGHVHVAVDLACIQSKAGCEVLFVSGGGTYESMLEQHNVHHVTVEQDHSKPLSLFRTFAKLTRLVRRFRPDVLHAHMMGSAAIGYLVSLITGVPLITTVHNSFDSHSGIMRLGRRVVAVSQAEKVELVRRGFDERRMDVIMNAPVNSPRDGMMQNYMDPVLLSPCIATVCGLHRRKGVFDLIEACSTIFGEFPGWRLYVAGDGPGRAELEQQARDSGIADRVIFLGGLRAPKVVMDQTDIFVLASHSEPFGLSVAEARAAGCAIVATNVGGIPEILEFGKAGRLVPSANPKELAAELRRLMANDQELNKLRRAALTGVEAFDVHRLLGDYDRVYQRALQTS